MIMNSEKDLEGGSCGLV